MRTPASRRACFRRPPICRSSRRDGAAAAAAARVGRLPLPPADVRRATAFAAAFFTPLLVAPDSRSDCAPPPAAGRASARAERATRRAPTARARRGRRDGGPVICRPIGRPSAVKPIGTDAAGRPVRLASAEKAIHAVGATARPSMRVGPVEIDGEGWRGRSSASAGNRDRSMKRQVVLTTRLRAISRGAELVAAPARARPGGASQPVERRRLRACRQLLAARRGRCRARPAPRTSAAVSPICRAGSLERGAPSACARRARRRLDGGAHLGIDRGMAHVDAEGDARGRAARPCPARASRPTSAGSEWRSRGVGPASTDSASAASAAERVIGPMCSSDSQLEMPGIALVAAARIDRHAAP